MADPQTTPPIPPLLSLDTFVDRAQVRINGAFYAIRNRGELSILADRRLQRLAARFAELWAIPEPTPDDELAASQILQQLCDQVLDAPMEVRAALDDFQRMQVVDSFLLLRLRRGLASGATDPATPPPATPTGVSTPPG